MIKKLALLCIIIGVWLIVLVFQAPETASKLEQILWMKGITSSILEFKGTVDKVATDIPTKNDLINTYNSLSSGALDAKNTVVDTANTTKQKVDDVRKTLSGAQETVTDTIETVQKAKEDLEKLQKLGQDVVNIVSSGSTIKK